MPQPKNGTYSSSRLNTKHSSRGIGQTRQKVSQVDWCLRRRTAGPSGRFSAPLTSQRCRRSSARPGHRPRPLHGESDSETAAAEARRQAQQCPRNHGHDHDRDEEDRAYRRHRRPAQAPVAGGRSARGGSSRVATSSQRRPAVGTGASLSSAIGRCRQPGDAAGGEASGTTAALSATIRVAAAVVSKRSIRSSSIPGCGIRQLQPARGVRADGDGVDAAAGFLDRRAIRRWSALTVDISSRPRATLAWCVARAT